MCIATKFVGPVNSENAESHVKKKSIKNLKMGLASTKVNFKCRFSQYFLISKGI